MRRKRRHIEGDVQLNMAAMLDMAFQLLAFFILTYRPSPVEGSIALRMPPPAPITKPDAVRDGGAPTPSEASALAGVSTLQIAVIANKDGSIAAIRVAEHRPVTDLQDFEQKLRALMKMSDIPFEQVLLKVGPTLEYENLLKIIEICARNKLTSGDQQTKLSIVEIP
jgi:biopolymer transport protein ExbD